MRIHGYHPVAYAVKGGAYLIAGLEHFALRAVQVHVKLFLPYIVQQRPGHAGQQYGEHDEYHYNGPVETQPGKDLFRIHFGHHIPGRAWHLADIGQHFLSAVITAIHKTCLAQRGLHGRDVPFREGHANGQRFIGPVAELIKEQGVFAFPAYQQGFGGAAGHGPGLYERVKELFRVRAQHKRGSCAFIGADHGGGYIQVYFPAIAAAEEIPEGRLPRRKRARD